MSATVELARSALFVPGDRPERFGKALASGADMVVADLEDAVAPANRPAAREHTVAALGNAYPLAVRISALGTDECGADVAALSASERWPIAIMVAKAEDPDRLSELFARFDGAVPIIALIETARGVLNSERIADTPGVRRLALGALDLAAEIGTTTEEALRIPRSMLVLASAAAQLAPPLESPSATLRDAAGLQDSTLHSRELGFGGRLCIHPAQIAPVHAGLRPSTDEVAAARRIVDASRSAAGGVANLDGKMVDRPVVESARRLLRLAEAD